MQWQRGNARTYGYSAIIVNSTPINNKIRIKIKPNNELQLYTTYDMRYTKPLDTDAPLTPRNASNKNMTISNGETVTDD